MAHPEFEEVVQKLRQLFAAEYARGEKAAIERIMQAAHRGTGTVKVARSHTFSNGDAAPRAPRGSVDTLINRVLTERGATGATATEIMNAAETPTEKAASYSGLRFALDRGRKQGRLLNKEGKWFLSATTKS